MRTNILITFFKNAGITVTFNRDNNAVVFQNRRGITCEYLYIKNDSGESVKIRRMSGQNIVNLESQADLENFLNEVEETLSDEDSFYIKLAKEEYGSSVRDNNRTSLIEIGRNFHKYGHDS